MHVKVRLDVFFRVDNLHGNDLRTQHFDFKLCGHDRLCVVRNLAALIEHIAHILTQIGLQDYCIHWLGDSYLSNLALAFIGLWRFTGYGMILYIGALQSIPSSLFEAAELDGAGFWHTIRHIVVPEIRPVIGLNLFLNINGSLQAFDQAFVITKGGPNGATETFVTGTLKTAFDYSNFGKASAMGVVLLAICIIVQLAQKLLLKGEQE